MFRWKVNVGHRITQVQEASGTTYKCAYCKYEAKYIYGVGWKVLDPGDGSKHWYGFATLPQQEQKDQDGDLPEPFMKFFRSKGWQ
jgi:hypothetical protein